MENNAFKINDSKNKPKSKWTHEQENLLAEWAEKAACYRWLHSKSEKKYTSCHYKYSIPIIILSTLTGTANFGIDSIVPPEYLKYAQMGIGGVNLFAGILGTLQNFFRYAELMESHRSVEILWSKFEREISVELALDPKKRKDADTFLALSRSQFDKLIEQSPPIPEQVINMFKSQFKNANIHKPDICNGIDPCGIYRPSQEEKVADVLVNATNKLRNIVPLKKKFNTARTALSSTINDNRKELEELKGNMNLTKNKFLVEENLKKQLNSQIKKKEKNISNVEENIVDIENGINIVDVEEGTTDNQLANKNDPEKTRLTK